MEYVTYSYLWLFQTACNLQAAVAAGDCSFPIWVYFSSQTDYLKSNLKSALPKILVLSIALDERTHTLPDAVLSPYSHSQVGRDNISSNTTTPIFRTPFIRISGLSGQDFLFPFYGFLLFITFSYLDFQFSGQKAIVPSHPDKRGCTVCILYYVHGQTGKNLSGWLLWLINCTIPLYFLGLQQ